MFKRILRFMKMTLRLRTSLWSKSWLSLVTENIPKKKLLPFQHFPKVALTPLPPPCFGHMRGNFHMYSVNFTCEGLKNTTSKVLDGV